MDAVKAFLNGSKQEILLGTVYIEAILTFAFVICSFVVATTANAGFNCVLTGFLNVCFAVGSYYVIKNSKAPIAVGFLIGSSAMITMLNFMTAVYWGQLSHCSQSYSVAGYSCENPSAYGAVCAFAVLLFLLQASFTIALYFWRGEFISETGLYDDISSASPNFPYETATGASGQFSKPPPSADL